MRWLKLGYALSIGGHVAAYFWMNRVEPPKPEKQQVAVMVSQQKKPEKKDKPKPPKPIEAPKEALRRPLSRPAAPPPPVAAPPPDPIAAAHPALAAMPDFGISLSGGGLGGGGISVPVGGQVARATPVLAKKEKIFAATAQVSSAEPEGELVKAKVEAGGFVQPTYTDDARAAGIEGRVRLQLTIDATGAVTDAKVLSGLGHGLDESAVTAAKKMKFAPAMRGGSPVSSTFVISMRFVLGE